jgi:opacity protein-like surface antigen
MENLETASGSTQSSVELSVRYGAKANIGYDLTEKAAPYLTVGYGIVEYQSDKYDNVASKMVTKIDS